MSLETDYLGMALKNPIVASSTPLTESLDSVRGLEDAGVAAIVMHSLFEEEIGGEDVGSRFAPDAYVAHLAKAKQAVDIPIIGSLNGVTPAGWLDYAFAIEDAGVDAIELNIYHVPADTEKPAQEIERELVEIVEKVERRVSIPVAVKLSPYFTSIPNVSRALATSGVDALVFFNRFYHPDLDLEGLKVSARLDLSTSSEMLLPLRWIAILYGRLPVDFAISTGVHTTLDVIKGLLAGASVAMMASALLHGNWERISDILHEVHSWMGENDFNSLPEMQGTLSQRRVGDPGAYERANYIKALKSYAIGSAR